MQKKYKEALDVSVKTLEQLTYNKIEDEAFVSGTFIIGR